MRSWPDERSLTIKRPVTGPVSGHSASNEGKQLAVGGVFRGALRQGAGGELPDSAALDLDLGDVRLQPVVGLVAGPMLEDDPLRVGRPLEGGDMVVRSQYFAGLLPFLFGIGADHPQPKVAGLFADDPEVELLLLGFLDRTVFPASTESEPAAIRRNAESADGAVPVREPLGLAAGDGNAPQIRTPPSGWTESRRTGGPARTPENRRSFHPQ